ncbi:MULTISPECIES: DUF3397 domain-containing protein [Bacillales]|uniref:DUF3397 domain-containing protein n=1 Tax=Bacillales TaxID=1385 RepID=UPI0018836F68|nr:MULTISPECIES: DUF3397 domain-containing protein [Bacillaceae]MBF0708344.1 DUF3397 domain-containing protein [Pseudalkalibacillus hwajinpoensis]MDO6655534.1 DUF3397 domain-containing protein [Anaerobacillus sp. 1_MG-2023]
MENLLSWIVATAVTIPLLAWYLVYIITVKTTRKKKFSFRLAVDVSTIFFILSVHFILVELLGQSFLWVILLMIIGAAGAFTVLHWKMKDDVEIHKVIKGAWRFNFLLFSTGYIVLVLIGLVHRILSV